MLSGEVVRALEFRMVHASGDRVRWFSQTNVPIRDERGQLTGIHGVAHDITQRKEMQAQIANAERLADLGRMAATIAHEIRNPLGAIVNSITVLRRPGASVDPRLLDIVTEEAARLDEIIRDVLLFARPPGRAPIACDLAALIEDTIVLFRRDQKLPERVPVTVRHDVPLPLIQLDPNQIKQVLWNVLKNAAEATAGGRIDIDTAISGDHVLVSVTDDGAGIRDPAEVFEPFYTTRRQGTGLGLTVVARIIQEHGGQVAVANAPGRGACVSFRLPLSGCGVES
jgi:signal transduction histidine kinase